LYTRLTFYQDINFEKIIWAIKSGIITIKFGINVNVVTDKIKNHGTSFCISPEHLYLLYKEKY
ncbi:MAG: hypothetical protein K2M17_02025, partial [Bacilli bacterium]|nr:hypothetical protein [Bacilli bacterium]